MEDTKPWDAVVEAIAKWATEGEGRKQLRLSVAFDLDPEATQCSVDVTVKVPPLGKG